MSKLQRSDLEKMDREDPLSGFRGHFSIPDNHIYMDGNSLGALPLATAQHLNRVVEEEWGQGLIRSWNQQGWVDSQLRLGDSIGELLGAGPRQVLVADSTSVNLYKLAAAALDINPQRRVILTDLDNFPTDTYILQGLTEQRQLELRCVPSSAILDAIDDDTALVALTHVNYKSGRVFDMAHVTKFAQQQGALVLWDLSHSVGALPVSLDAAGVDFAVGCGYKYLNGGPGAPAFLYVATRHQQQAQSPLWGWFGHQSPFTFENRYKPAADINRFQCGTPSILALAALECGVELMRKADMQQVRAKSLALGELFIQLAETHCPELEIITPRDPDVRGSHVSITHPQGYAIMQALINRNIIGDFRDPNVMRFGLTPLYMRYTDVWDCVQAIKEIVNSGSWDTSEFLTRSKVT